MNTRNNKRKQDNATTLTPTKKVKHTITNMDIWEPLHQPIVEDNNWVSASSTKNYLLHDPLIDWLDMYHGKKTTKPHITKKQSQQTHSKPQPKNILFEMGNTYEEKIFKDLITKYGPNNVITICTTRQDFSNKDNYNKTLLCMKAGTPIILQAMLVNDVNKTFGVADILIRSDYVNKLFVNPALTTEEETLTAPLLDGQYHYIVIDIKWSTIPLKADSKTILNQDRMPAYKGQLAIYNLALGIAQGYIPPCAYIMGKSWKCDSRHTSNTNCYDKLAVIDYKNSDNSTIQSVSHAVGWIRDVRNNGHTWDCYKPHRSELYPNMTTKNDIWGKVKKDIATKIKEITQIYYVGHKNRQSAHKHSIFSWDNPQCNSKTLNINGKIIGPRVDAILNINRDTTSVEPILLPSTIPPAIALSSSSSSSPTHSMEFYIDFETLNECLVDKEIVLSNSYKQTNIIFMIGIGHEDPDDNKHFIFKTFTIEKVTGQSLSDGERQILGELFLYVEKVNTLNRPVRFYHWGNAEVSFMSNANIRHLNIFTTAISNITCVDLCKIFTEIPIVVKGALNFKLKEVANAMHAHGMIQTKWNTEQVADGFGAMLLAADYYSQSVCDEKQQKLFDEITIYNNVDCRVLWEIITYLRTKMI